MKRIGSVVAASLVGLLLLPATSQSSTLLVPKTPWPVCSSTIVEFCIESVSIQSPGQAAEQLTWVPSGSASPNSGAPTTTSTTTTTTPGSTTTTTVPTTTVPTTTTTTPTASQSTTPLAGTWTDATWGANGHGALGFSGLYVEASAANVFSNFMVFNVLPTLQDPTSNDVFLADQPGTSYPASLSPDDIVTVSVETGNALPGVTMAIGNNFSDVVGTDANGSTLTFSASPVPVAVASNTNQCVGETGVAAAEVTQLQAIVAPSNDPNAGFGVDGVSGRMYVESNGACVLSTPVWDATSQTLTWTVGAPHFLPDGTTVNQGFYQAMIPGADATLLWGLTNINQAASALVVSETSSGGATSQIAESSVAVKGGNIIISATGFNFSSPKFKISKNPRYKHFSSKKPRTIICERGKHVKRVTSRAPRCPAGFHLK
ncbi:MAG: hypothetical protein ACYC19_08500 [Acidimicrobiales bacterium]